MARIKYYLQVEKCQGGEGFVLLSVSLLSLDVNARLSGWVEDGGKNAEIGLVWIVVCVRFVDAHAGGKGGFWP